MQQFGVQALLHAVVRLSFYVLGGWGSCWGPGGGYLLIGHPFTSCLLETVLQAKFELTKIADCGTALSTIRPYIVSDHFAHDAKNNHIDVVSAKIVSWTCSGAGSSKFHG